MSPGSESEVLVTTRAMIAPVAAKGIEASLVSGSDATGVRYFPERYVDRIAAATRRSGLVDGIAPVIIEPTAVQDVSSR